MTLPILRKISDSVFIYTLADTYKSLLKTQEILDKLPDYFIQIHASYIVNPKYIKDFDAKTVTILLNGTEGHSLQLVVSSSLLLKKNTITTSVKGISNANRIADH